MSSDGSATVISRSGHTQSGSLEALSKVFWEGSFTYNYTASDEAVTAKDSALRAANYASAKSKTTAAYITPSANYGGSEQESPQYFSNNIC